MNVEKLRATGPGVSGAAGRNMHGGSWLRVFGSMEQDHLDDIPTGGVLLALSPCACLAVEA